MRTLLLAATALVVLGGASYAQTSAAGSDSRSTAINSSASQSSSVASPRVNVIGNPIGNGASSSTSGARATASTRSSSGSAAIGNTTNIAVGYTGTSGGDPTTATGTTKAEQYIGYGGSYTVRNTPEVIPPNIVGGNACAVGASAGVSVAGVGLAGGATWADRACERRQQAALLYNMGEQKVALELMCQDESVRTAMRVGGKPCSADTAAASPTAAVAQVAAVTAASAPVVTAAAPPAAPKPAWCSKAAPTTEASKAYVEQECGG